MKLLTKSHDDLIREEARLLRELVFKARRRQRVLYLAKRRARSARSGRIQAQVSSS